MQQIEKYVTKSLGAKVLVRSTNQSQTSYAVAALLLEFKSKKILIDKIETNESINRSDIQRNLYNALVKSYNTHKDILSSYDDVVALKRGQDDQDKDKDSSTGSDRRMKRRKSSKDAELLKDIVGLVVVVVESGVGCGVIVVRCGEGLTEGGGEGTIKVSIRELISGDGSSKFRSLLVKLDETKELCKGPSVLS
nr:hypothetical protein [Tanacetum cinerariifolium]